MANHKFLLDNDVRHLESCFPEKQTRQLGDVGLDPSASDDAIVAAASEHNHIVVTNNRRDFQRAVKQRIAASKKKDMGCTQVHGLIVVLPSLKLKQEQALRRASKQLKFDGKIIGWKEVNAFCLEVIIEENGNATVTKLPRCPHCLFDDKD